MSHLETTEQDVALIRRKIEGQGVRVELSEWRTDDRDRTPFELVEVYSVKKVSKMVGELEEIHYVPDVRVEALYCIKGLSEVNRSLSQAYWLKRNNWVLLELLAARPEADCGGK